MTYAQRFQREVDALWEKFAHPDKEDWIFIEDPEDQDFPEHNHNYYVELSNWRALRKALDFPEVAEVRNQMGPGIEFPIWKNEDCRASLEDLTDACAELMECQAQLERYPLLDDESYYQLISEAAVKGIDDEFHKYTNLKAPDTWAVAVHQWIGENHDDWLYNTDDLSVPQFHDLQIIAALDALGWLNPERRWEHLIHLSTMKYRTKLEQEAVDTWKVENRHRVAVVLSDFENDGWRDMMNVPYTAYHVSQWIDQQIEVFRRHIPLEPETKRPRFEALLLQLVEFQQRFYALEIE